MLEKQELRVGKWYVNYGSKVARAVLGVSDTTVTFITYHLDTGNSCGSASECARADFIRWADHEATPVEIARLKSFEREAFFEASQSADQTKMKRGRTVEPPGASSQVR